MRVLSVLALVALCFLIDHSIPADADGVSTEDLAVAMSTLASEVEGLKTRLAAAESKIKKLEGAGSGDAAGEVDESAVLVLDGSNFDATIKASAVTLVEFYAPWCGHCKALKPEYAKAALALQGKHQLAKVDCTTDDNKELCSKYEIQGFPTIKLFYNDGTVPTDYNGDRDASAIAAWVAKQALPAVSDLKDEAAVKAFAPGEDVKVIGFFAADDAEGETAFRKVASSLRNSFSFGLVKGDEAAAKAAGASVPSVVLMRNFDDDAVFTGELSGLESFIKAESLPLMGTLTAENYRNYYERGFPFVWVFIDFESEEQQKMVTDVITPIASEQRATLSFVKMDGEKWAEHISQMGAKGTPAIIIEDREKGKNFVFDQSQTVTSDGFRSWIAGYLDGSLKPLLKSEEIPEDNSGPVKVVVGKTFEEIVFDKDKDVLVEFYAPWCGHCKSLAPKYEELGQKFADNDKVVIAKVDATANDTPTDVKGFPTIILYPAGDKENPVEFTGERSAAAMAEFIAEKGKAGGKEDL